MFSSISGVMDCMECAHPWDISGAKTTEERWAKDKEREGLWAIKQMCWGSADLLCEELWPAPRSIHPARQALGLSHPQGWSPLGKDQALGDITVMRTLNVSGGKFAGLHLNTAVKASTDT